MLTLFCWIVLQEKNQKKALQNDTDCNNRKMKRGDKENMHSETKENDPSKSNEFVNPEFDAMLEKGLHSTKEQSHPEAKGKENDERNAKKKHKSKSKSKGKKKHKSKLSKSMRRL